MTTETYTPLCPDKSSVRTIEDLCLFSDQIDIRICEISKSGFRRTPVVAQSTLDGELDKLQQTDANNRTALIFIPQSNSRGPFKITADGYRSLLKRIRPFPALSNVLSSFTAGSSDCYLGRTSAYFSPYSWSPSRRVLELCCILKYVERNGRIHTGAHAWSVRQMAIYQRLEPASQRETVILANPSTDIWTHVKTSFEPEPSPQLRPWESWTHTPTLVISRLRVDWDAYMTELHDAVSEIRRNAAFTDPRNPRVGEVDGSSLKSAAAYMDLLQHASHALQSNVHVLSALAREGARRADWLAAEVADPLDGRHRHEQQQRQRQRRRERRLRADHDDLRGAVEEAAREMHALGAQVRLITTRLQQTIAAIRDNISLRTSYSMERMTARSLAEARAVRVIALVTLIFLPPTFTSGFMDMGYISVARDPGKKGLGLVAAPEMWLFLVLTVPLLVVTVGAWLWWNRRVWKQDYVEGELLV